MTAADASHADTASAATLAATSDGEAAAAAPAAASTCKHVVESAVVQIAVSVVSRLHVDRRSHSGIDPLTDRLLRLTVHVDDAVAAAVVVFDGTAADAVFVLDADAVDATRLRLVVAVATPGDLDDVCDRLPTDAVRDGPLRLSDALPDAPLAVAAHDNVARDDDGDAVSVDLSLLPDAVALRRNSDADDVADAAAAENVARDTLPLCDAVALMSAVNALRLGVA
jgi:hypothetical protein